MMGCYGYMGWLWWVKLCDCEIVDVVLVCVGMSEFCYWQIGEFFGGQKKCVFLVCVIVQQGQVILLDEFFIGVDVQIEVWIISLLCEFCDEGCIMLVFIYNFGLVSEFCDYMVMVKGIVLVSGLIEIIFIVENLEWVFSGVLCYVVLIGVEV